MIGYDEIVTGYNIILNTILNINILILLLRLITFVIISCDTLE